jgi:uncharacterized protein (TIRG00374 family)
VRFRRLHLVPLLVGFALVLLLVVVTGPGATLATLARLHAWQGGALVALALMSTAFGALTSRVILGHYGHRVAVWLLFRLSLVAFAVGWLVPSGYTAGFPVAAWFLRRRGVPFGQGVAAFVIQRLLELLAFASLLPAIVLGARAVVAPRVALLLPVVGLGLVMLDLTLGWRLGRRTLSVAGRVVPPFVQPALERGIRFCATVASFFDAPVLSILAAAGPSILSLGAALVRAFLTAHFLHLPFGVAEVALIFAVTLLVIGLPVSPGALGVYEGGMAGLFHMLGRSPVEGVAYAMTVHGVEIVVAGLGVFFLGQLGIDLARVRDASECSVA